VVMAEVVVLIFRMWDLNFGTWISHSGLHMIQEARDFTVFEGHGHPLACVHNIALTQTFCRWSLFSADVFAFHIIKVVFEFVSLFLLKIC